MTPAYYPDNGAKYGHDGEQHVRRNHKPIHRISHVGRLVVSHQMPPGWNGYARALGAASGTRLQRPVSEPLLTHIGYDMLQ